MSATRESPVSIPVRESRRREHSLWQQFELSSPFPSFVAGRNELPPFGQRTLPRMRTDGGVTTAAHAAATSMRCTHMAPRRDTPVGDVEDSFYPRIAGSEVTAVFRTSPATVLCEGREERRRRRGRGQDASHITPERRRDAEGATVRPALVTWASPGRLSTAHGRWSYHSIEVVRLDDIVLCQPWKNFLAFTTDSGSLSLLLTRLAISCLLIKRAWTIFLKFRAGMFQFCLLQPQFSGPVKRIRCFL